MFSMFSSSREEKIKIGEQYVDMLKKLGVISEKGKYIVPVSSSNEEREMELKEDQHLSEQKQQQSVAQAAISHKEMGSQSSSCDSCDLLEQEELSVDARIIDPMQERLRHAQERRQQQEMQISSSNEERKKELKEGQHLLEQKQQQSVSKAAVSHEEMSSQSSSCDSCNLLEQEELSVDARIIDPAQERRQQQEMQRVLKEKFKELVNEYGPYSRANDTFIERGNQTGNYTDLLCEMIDRYKWSLGYQEKCYLACGICENFDFEKGLSLLNKFWDSVPRKEKYNVAKAIKEVLDPHYVGKKPHHLLNSVNDVIARGDIQYDQPSSEVYVPRVRELSWAEAAAEEDRIREIWRERWKSQQEESERRAKEENAARRVEEYRLYGSDYYPTYSRELAQLRKEHEDLVQERRDRERRWW
jgi:hypothetical protein